MEDTSVHLYHTKNGTWFKIMGTFNDHITEESYSIWCKCKESFLNLSNYVVIYTKKTVRNIIDKTISALDWISQVNIGLK